MMTLNDVYPLGFSGSGIFSDLSSLDVPWKTSITSANLDAEYHGNRSGDKTVSPLLDKIFPNGETTSTSRALLANTIFALCGENWSKMWDTLSFTYNPIENYSMEEKMTNDQTQIAYGKSHTRTDNLSHAKTGTETQTPLTTETTTPGTTKTVDNSVYGFDSSTDVPAGKQTESMTGTITRGMSGSDTLTHNTTDTDTGTQTDADTGTDTHTRNYTLTRSGNIGVTTSQQMIESERDLWKWKFFYDVVFPDIDRVCTIKIY